MFSYRVSSLDCMPGKVRFVTLVRFYHVKSTAFYISVKLFEQLSCPSPVTQNFGALYFQIHSHEPMKGWGRIYVG